jgi:hypothetical protein
MPSGSWRGLLIIREYLRFAQPGCAYSERGQTQTRTPVLDVSKNRYEQVMDQLT